MAGREGTADRRTVTCPRARRIDAPAAAVWREVADWGAIARWGLPFTRVDLAVDRGRPVRRLVTDRGTIAERLAWCRPDERRLAFVITEGAPFGIDDYRAEVAVEPLLTPGLDQRAAGACRLSWVGTFTVPTADAARAEQWFVKAIDGVLAAVARTTEARAESAPPATPWQRS